MKSGSSGGKCMYHCTQDGHAYTTAITSPEFSMITLMMGIIIIIIPIII
jgi:hypothetical protein